MHYRSIHVLEFNSTQPIKRIAIKQMSWNIECLKEDCMTLCVSVCFCWEMRKDVIVLGLQIGSVFKLAVQRPSVAVLLCLCIGSFPAGTQHQNDVVSTSMRRDHVASTLIRRHFNVVCLQGYFAFVLSFLFPIFSSRKGCVSWLWLFLAISTYI